MTTDTFAADAMAQFGALVLADSAMAQILNGAEDTGGRKSVV